MWVGEGTERYNRNEKLESCHMRQDNGSIKLDQTGCAVEVYMAEMMCTHHPLLKTRGK
jgi:hypothetical protein